MSSYQRTVFASGANGSTSASIARLVAHLGTPLYRNGYALVLSSASTSVLGAVYWILAARNYAAMTVGLNAAAISGMMFLAGASQLNLSSALLRFIPGAGRATGRFVMSAYLISIAIAAIVSLCARGLERWAPTLSFLGSSPIFSQLFVVATIAWCIFVLQDGVLTGLRRATWVPIENVAFSLTKVALLLVFAQPFPQYGVFASWVVAMALTLLPVNALIFRRLIPRHMAATPDHGARLIPKQVVRYVAGDYVGGLCWLASTTLLPVMVTQQAGATVNAYFYLSWQIAFALYVVSPNMGSSLIVEAAHDPIKLNSYSYRVFVNAERIVIPVAAILALGAPYVLRLFGHSYATEGATLLRLLALSAIPHTVTSLYVSIARVQRRVTAVATVLASFCILVLTLSYVLLRIYGIAGVGVAWLVSQTAIALVLLATQLRPLWSSLRPDETASAGPFQHDRRMIDWLHTVASKLRLIALRHRLKSYRSNRRSMSAATALLPRILPAITPPAHSSLPTTWTAVRVISTVTEMTVIAVGPSKQSPVAVLKVPRTDAARRSLQREHQALTALHADPRLGEWRALLPSLLDAGEVESRPYVAEQMLSGRDARRVLGDPGARTRMQIAAVTAIRELHRRTAVVTVVDTEMLLRWIDEPVLAVRRTVAALPRVAGNDRAIERLTIELHEALAGRRLPVSWIHGDFTPGNILVTPDGARLTGIIDWDQAAPDDLPMLDIGLLLLSMRMIGHRRELGDVVSMLLNGAQWTAQEQILMSVAALGLPGDVVGVRTMVLLCWLRHVAANLTKADRYRGHRLWVAKNVETVLQRL